MMMTWMFVGCETVRQVKAGCFGYWEDSGSMKRGTRGSRKTFSKPYRQCVEKSAPHRNTEQKPYG